MRFFLLRQDAAHAGLGYADGCPAARGFALVQAPASILLMTQALFPVGVAMFGLGQCSLPHVVVEPFDGIADDAVLLNSLNISWRRPA